MTTSSTSTSTTAAPETTTTAAPETTTTAAPETTTTAAAAETTTEAPAETTTAAGETSTSTTAAAPSTSTTAASGDAPTVEEVTFAIEPDDGADHNPHSIQISTDATLTLTWTTQNAASVRIDPLPGPFDASGSTELPSEDASYTIVAVADGGAESAPYSLDVHTHEPGEVVSAHVEVSSGIAKVLSFTANSDGVAAGASVELSVLATVDVESIKVGDDEVELSDTGDGQKSGTVTVTIPDDGSTSVTYTAEASKDGAAADAASLIIQIAVSTSTTTAAVSSTTTAAQGTTTTAAPATTTTAPSTSTTDPDAALRNLQWAADAYSHGKPIELSAEADVEDGRVVYFAIEQDEDASGNWQPLKEVQATFASGRASVTTLLDDDDDDQHNHQFRFHASFTSGS